VAHRGASREAPENTPAAFAEALRQGCDAIELDVQLSADGVPVVWHDRTLARAGAGRRRAAHLAADDLVRLGLPTLEQVLSRHGRQTRWLVELKTAGGRLDPAGRERLVGAVLELLRRLRLERRALLLCFDAAALDQAAARMPHLPRVLNLSPPPWATRRLLARLGSLSGVSCDVRALTPAFGRAIGRAGLPLFAYTCNTPARVRRALLAGASAIMTDRPGWLGEHLRRLELERGA
jgi:glycerophosphoryl diester phosphodiesterase